MNVAFEEQNAVLQRHTQSMSSARERLEQELALEERRTLALQQQLQAVRQALTASFASLPVPGADLAHGPAPVTRPRPPPFPQSPSPAYRPAPVTRPRPPPLPQSPSPAYRPAPVTRPRPPPLLQSPSPAYRPAPVTRPRPPPLLQSPSPAYRPAPVTRPRPPPFPQSPSPAYRPAPVTRPRPSPRPRLPRPRLPCPSPLARPCLSSRLHHTPPSAAPS
ncbi:SWI/SNF-related matrix-associated actin-dependent regulator of chromatin subfamily E member 1-related [Plecturocebus cupreus]